MIPQRNPNWTTGTAKKEHKKAQDQLEWAIGPAITAGKTYLKKMEKRALCLSTVYKTNIPMICFIFSMIFEGSPMIFFIFCDTPFRDPP